MFTHVSFPLFGCEPQAMQERDADDGGSYHLLLQQRQPLASGMHANGDGNGVAAAVAMVTTDIQDVSDTTNDGGGSGSGDDSLGSSSWDAGELEKGLLHGLLEMGHVEAVLHQV